jgi:tetratricopeptide (TPR) repeat protein
MKEYPAAMIRLILVLTLFASRAIPVPASAQTPHPAPTHHDANFDSERNEANELFLAEKILESLPLYEDLCRQDQTIAVFAERHAAGLLAKQATVSNPTDKTEIHTQAIKELQRAQALGDKSDYARNVLGAESKTSIGAIITGIPLTVGYTYQGNAAAKPIFQEAEAAFGRSDIAGALPLYIQAANLDPAFYGAALCVGDMYARLKDTPNALLWYAKGIAIDPDRETAYRWSGDALFHAGDQAGAGRMYVEAAVAEPYGRSAFGQLGSWAKLNHRELTRPDITRPEFITPQGILKIDPVLAASTSDGRSSWIVYQQYRVAHGARVLNQFMLAGASDSSGVVVKVDGYRHTIAEEHAALRAMLSDLETNIKTGAVLESNLDPSLRNIRSLENAGFLGAWIAINAADAGIRSDYPEYRAKHRQHLVDYVTTYLIH